MIAPINNVSAADNNNVRVVRNPNFNTLKGLNYYKNPSNEKIVTNSLLRRQVKENYTGKAGKEIAANSLLLQTIAAHTSGKNTINLSITSKSIHQCLTSENQVEHFEQRASSIVKLDEFLREADGISDGIKGIKGKFHKDCLKSLLIRIPKLDYGEQVIALDKWLDIASKQYDRPKWLNEMILYVRLYRFFDRRDVFESHIKEVSFNLAYEAVERGEKVSVAAKRFGLQEASRLTLEKKTICEFGAAEAAQQGENVHFILEEFGIRDTPDLGHAKKLENISIEEGGAGDAIKRGEDFRVVADRFGITNQTYELFLRANPEFSVSLLPDGFLAFPTDNAVTRP